MLRSNTMNRAESAAQNITTHRMNCSQSVLTAFCEELGLNLPLARKVALGFGGGMGRMGKTCGAVTGAYMVIGLKQNITSENGPQVKDKVNRLIQEFNKEFTAKNGSITCKDLLGCDLSTPEGSTQAKEKGLFSTLCPRFVKSAVEILETLE
jgi:C_GCAxxG_C_C family probable redox protein